MTRSKASISLDGALLAGRSRLTGSSFVSAQYKERVTMNIIGTYIEKTWVDA